MRKKLTRPQIEEIVRAKLKDKLSENEDPLAPPGWPADAKPAPMPEVGLDPRGPQPAPMPDPDLPPTPPPNMYGGQDDASNIYDYFNVQPPTNPPPARANPPEYQGEEGQAMTPPPGNRDLDAESARRYGRSPGNRDTPVMPPLREGENMDEGVGMYLMNKAGAISDSDYKNYKKEQEMKKQNKMNLGTSADDIKQGTGRARQMSQIDSGGTTESQLRQFVRSKLTQILEGSGDRNDDDREQGHGKQRQRAGSDGSEGELEERRRTKDRLQGHPHAPNQEKVSESIFAPNHYCIHHGGVHLNGKVHMAEAVSHNYNEKLGKVTHYNMKLSDGRILENVPAEAIQVTSASLALEHGGHSASMPAKRDDEADKDYDGDGKVESGTEEYMGSKDKAIKKAMKSEGSGDRNDKDREQGHGKQRQRAGSDGKKGELEEASDKEWYDNQLFESLSRKWTK